MHRAGSALRKLFASPARRPSALSVVLAAGAGVGVLLLLVVPSRRREREVDETFVQRTCAVVDRRVVRDGKTYRPELLLDYSYGAAHYRTWSARSSGTQSDRSAAEAAIGPYRPPTQRPCWVDPRAPERAFVLRGVGPTPWFLVAFALGLLAFGGRGLYWNRRLRGLSPGEAAALREGGGRAASGSKGSPSPVPAPEHGPGAELAYRLPVGHEREGVTLPIGLFFTSLFGLLATLAGVTTWRTPGADKLVLGLVFVVTAALTTTTLAHVVRRALLALGVPPTTVELSHSPIVAGEPFRVFVGQRGSMLLNSFRVTLACEERVSYSEGTSQRLETRTVYEALLFAEEFVRVRRGEPLTLRCEHCLPPRVMHSFEAANNSVRWSLRCRGDILNFPDFDREVRLVVLPAAPRRGTPYRAAPP